MRSTITALLVATATAGFADRLTNHVVETLATGANKQKTKKGGEHKPQLQQVSFDTSSTFTDTSGFALGANADVGMAYESPLYNENEYLVNRFQLSLYAGGRSSFRIWTSKIQFNIFMDVWGLKFTFFDNYMRYNVVEYGDFCTAAQWFLEVARVQFFAEIDAYECAYALLDSDDDMCGWANYYIDHPFLEYDWFEDFWRGDLLDNDCGNEWYDGEMVAGEQESFD